MSALASRAAPAVDPAEPISPELVLVDPELAARLRALEPAPEPEGHASVLRLVPPAAERAEPAPAREPVQESPSNAPGGRGGAALLGGLVGAVVTAAAVAVATLGHSDIPVAPVSSSPSTAASAADPTPPTVNGGLQAPVTPRVTLTKPKPKLKPKPVSTVGPTPRPKTSGGGSQRAKGAPAKLEPRRFAWAPVAGADAYRVELFRGSTRVFAQRITSALLALPATWRYQGKQVTLTPGSYRWYVWAIMPDGPSPRAIVQAKLTVP